MLPSDIPTTLAACLSMAVEDMKDASFLTFLEDGSGDGETVSARQFEEKTLAIASQLQERASPGSRVLIALPSSIEFVASFFACQYARMVAVPIYPLDARSKRIPDATINHLELIISDCEPEIIISNAETFRDWGELLSGSELISDLIRLTVDHRALQPSGSPSSFVEGSSDDLAFLQYTSGSTGSPKGVMVSHSNILQNLATIAESAFGERRNLTLGTWLPLYHDLGLVSNVLLAPFTRSHLVFMDPMRFIQRPTRWLRMIDKWRINSSGGPNFAFDLCVRAIPPALLRDLDLSCWDIAYICAEPIRQKTVESFVEKFAPAGFKAEAMFPSYGLAEATLMVASDRPSIPIRLAGANNSVVAVSDPECTYRVSSGKIAPRVTVKIVDPETRAVLEDGQEGEVWVQGPNVAQGYWANPQATAFTFEAMTNTGEGPFLRTGDLGFVTDSEVFITGRIKELMIVRGRHFYPSEFEDTVQAISKNLKTSAGIAFSFQDDGLEKIAIAHETTAHPGEFEQLAHQIFSRTSERFQVCPSEVIFVPAGGIPKTFNGKLKRRQFKEDFLAGRINAVWSKSFELEGDGDAE